MLVARSSLWPVTYSPEPKPDLGFESGYFQALERREGDGTERSTDGGGVAALREVEVWLVQGKTVGLEKSLISTSSNDEHCARDNLQIQPDRPIVDVVQIMLHPLAHRLCRRRFAPESINLRPAGYSRTHASAP